ncbi:MAG: preprotein translocase subunit SecA, partial [Planctomycetes bacterium]|nr:preprotein translocase subunit SecA [Planctomycetota bacterium]
MDWENINDKLSNIGENTGRFFKRLMGSANERAVRQIQPLVDKIAAEEEWAKSLTAEQFEAQTERWKAAIAAQETTLDDLLPQAFALCREAAVRTLGLRHYDVQMVGGITMHQGAIAEMMTGEGKTLVATLPLYLNALSGKTCYLVTVNDYLARRDAFWMAPVYEYLGLTVGAIQSDMSPQERIPVYGCDIVYGTNNEFGFDYLRDNMKNRVEDQVQKELYFAIIDEVDSILIDEARTPLIISGPAESGVDRYQLADQIARALKKDEHYEVKEKERSASLLEAGIEEAERMAGIDSFYTPGNEDWPHYIENAIKAHELYRHDKEYVVENGDVIIVDEFTGRKMEGRRWSDGLHQAVEVKEGLEPRQENQTLATITYQNYFRMFDKLSGMTGTAITEAGEFHKIYDLDVVSIPTNLPIARNDANDVVYRTEPEKWKAIADEVQSLHEKGQPVLIGTTSVEKSEIVHKHLQDRGIPHSVLNAKIGEWEKEANIVATAGDKAAVTVATNMAGRGTDIKLGGNFEYRLRKALEEAGLNEGDKDNLEAIDKIREEVRERCERDEAEVLELGGLYVLGTERHESRRVDNQLRGRSGRQGDVGVSRFFLSLEDDLMRIFYSERMKNLMGRIGMSEGQPIESGMVTRAIGRAQKKVEDRNFEIRKSLLEYDEVMDKQRKDIYSRRQEVLEGRETKDKTLALIERSLDRACKTYVGDQEGFQGWFQRTFGFEISEGAAAKAVEKGNQDDGPAIEEIEAFYEEREKTVTPDVMRRIESYVLLNAIDSRWKDHLRAVDGLKAGIGLRGYAQHDPKTEYKIEGTKLFHKLHEAIEDEVASIVLRIRVAGEEGGPPAPGQRPAQAPPTARPMTSGGAALAAEAEARTRAAAQAD